MAPAFSPAPGRVCHSIAPNVSSTRRRPRPFTISLLILGEFKPEWTYRNLKHIGEIVWLDFPVTAANAGQLTRVSVNWGDEAHADVRVLPEADE